MSDTVQPTETAPQGNSKTTEPTQAPTQGNASDAEVERLRKEAEQARMRAQQLENELKAKKDAEEAAKAKELEEQNQFKSLYEQSQAKLKEIEEQQTRAERQKELEAGTQTVFSEFSQNVVEIAKEAGITLSDTSEEAKAALKEKLQRIQAKAGDSSANTPNNPQVQAPGATTEVLIEQARYGNRQEQTEAKQKLIGGLEAVKAMKQMAGYQDK